MNQKNIALQLAEESLKEIESKKCSVLTAINKLNRSAIILGKDDIRIWCAIQLGDSTYTNKLKELVKIFDDNPEKEQKELTKLIQDKIKELKDLGLNPKIHFNNEEFTLKANASSGGYSNIGFIEERYSDLVRTKKGNDGTHYKNNLNEHINYVKKITHDFASEIFNELKFSGTISTCFDVLKNAVDDRLLDLNPALAEQLMLTFKAISTDNKEEWSQSLTTCRRLLEGIADELFPATDEKLNGRPLGQTQYVNRLWAYMDKSIESNSNKELAKIHVDYLGSWIEKINKLTNKGVHADVTQIEATKTVFHVYLMISDLLEYLDKDKSNSNNINIDINNASLDELESVLNINRNVAKEIVKARIKFGELTNENIKQITGVGPKTLSIIQEKFSLK